MVSKLPVPRLETAISFSNLFIKVTTPGHPHSPRCNPLPSPDPARPKQPQSKDPERQQHQPHSIVWTAHEAMAPHVGFNTEQVRDKARKDLLYLLEGVSSRAGMRIAPVLGIFRR